MSKKQEKVKVKMFGDNVNKKFVNSKAMKYNTLKDLPIDTTSPNTGTTWPQIQQQIADGKVCARRQSWSTGDFMFCHQGTKKYINEKTTAGAFYEPITLQFLQKNKLKGFTVQSHYNRWRYKTAILQVGFFPSMDDRDANDWVIYEP